MLSFDDLDRLRARYKPGTPIDPLTVERFMAEAGRRYLAHPLTRQYIAHLDRRESNTQPWHAVGETLYWGLMLTHVGEPFAPIMSENASNPDLSPRARAMMLIFRLMLSQPYLWSSTIHDHLRFSPDLPRHVISRSILPYPYMFWSREGATVIRGADGRETDSNFALICDEGDGITFFCDTSYGPDEPPRIESTSILYGQVYPDDFPDEDTRLGVAYFLKAMAFQASPFVETRRERLPRGFRRDIARAGLPNEETERLVGVVVLRRAVQTRDQAEREAIERGVEWKHHWWVSGHYRAQWYPSEQAHRVIWVAPHLKGDLDKPLLEKVYAVVR